jgi:galactofuranosylgalactofuranosylrhamnosyl-N-acetylglucosaminyl-diphospho-decaprenol beta-1,5/1,6-galactofuranosyltransferase
MLPDPDLPNSPEVFVRLSQGAAVAGGGIALPSSGASLRVDTYANLFNLGTWAAHGPVTDLALDLTGTGPVTLHLWQVSAQGEQTLIESDVTLKHDGISLPIAPAQPGGLLMWSLTARGGAHLDRAAITAKAPAAAPIRLAIAITTFGREEAVRATATRISAFLGAGQLPGAHLFVIDNGRSVTLPDHPDVTLIPNRNLGGAGGFARGLTAARDAFTFSHVLFMDDDAAFQMENLTRTAAFLRHATDPATALAGAMISAVRPWELWEIGGEVDRIARSRFMGTDLRDADAVTAMELVTPTPPATGFYGAWWYFAFPLAAVAHDPYPFFVRGDDIWFSLSNPFRIATLNGVMSLQDDFAAKASPQTAYLDMRCNLLINIMRTDLRTGVFGIIHLALQQAFYAASRMHYETAAAGLTAWEDLLKGPDDLIRNIAMTDKRAQIAALIQVERWGPRPADLPPTHPSMPRANGWPRLRQMLTLNGHLLPGLHLWGRDVTVPLGDRASFAALRNARRAVFLDDTDRAYVVTHSKATFARLMLRAAGLSLRWLIAWPGLSRDWRAAMGPMTSPAFWADHLFTAEDSFADKG